MDITPTRDRAHGLGRTQEFLKQIVYGGNDGIVTTFAIVAGFAGAQADGVAQIGGLAVLVFGLANLFADAVSMGLGEVLSGRAAHDLYRGRHEIELAEIARNPEWERQNLVRVLHRRGLPEREAETVSDVLIRHPQMMADLLLNYDLGMSNPADDTPLINGLVTFVSFVMFGAVPLVPYLLFDASSQTFVLSVSATFSALAALGLLRWNATGERLLRTLGETVVLGAICALVAYSVGFLVGG